MKEATRKRIEDLERRVRELEARPQQTIIYASNPPQWIPPQQFAPTPAWPPYTVTCTTGSPEWIQARNWN